MWGNQKRREAVARHPILVIAGVGLFYASFTFLGFLVVSHDIEPWAVLIVQTLVGFAIVAPLTLLGVRYKAARGART